MRFKIDLKIFIFLILFYFTKQIETYVLILFFAMIHELGHLTMGLAMGMKPEKLEIKPYGISISFKLMPEDFNVKIKNGNIFQMKKVLVALAGPITNLIIIVIASKIEMSIFVKLMIIYSNILLVLFNILPIYPLDGGRILRGFLHIALGKKKAEKISNVVNFVMVVVLTVFASIGILYFKNIAIFLIDLYLWYVVIREDKIYERRRDVQEILEKMEL